ERLLHRAREVVAHRLHRLHELEEAIDRAAVLRGVAEHVVDGRLALEAKAGAEILRARRRGGALGARGARAGGEREHEDRGAGHCAHYGFARRARQKLLGRRASAAALSLGVAQLLIVVLAEAARHVRLAAAALRAGARRLRASAAVRAAAVRRPRALAQPRQVALE